MMLIVVGLLALSVVLALRGLLRPPSPKVLVPILGLLGPLWWLAFASPTARVWWAVDTCLDRGGRWNDTLRTCED